MLNPTELTAMLTDKISRAVDEMPPEMHCGVPNLRELSLQAVPDLCQEIQDTWGEMLATCAADFAPSGASPIEVPFAQVMDEYVRCFIDGFIAGYTKGRRGGGGGGGQRAPRRVQGEHKANA